jgi:tetratricopeptide (TPR) repeat protein
MATFSAAQLEEIAEVQGTTPFRPVRQHFGIMTFGVNAMTAHADGDRLIGEHEEAEPESGEELYVVISGAPLFPLFASGEYELGAERAQKLLIGDPPYSGVYYNTACFESQAGRLEDALNHLKRAVELLPALADLAREDEDFEPLRDRPEFAQIVGDQR